MERGLTIPSVKFDSNFQPLFDELLSCGIGDKWIGECLVNLKAQKLDVDSEIRKTIKDW